jgi:pyrroline-5-carboxylate reductase
MFDGKTIGFIGSGNMGTAMIHGLINSHTMPAERIIASDVNPDRLKMLSADYKIRTTADNATVAAEADILVISVKPQVVDHVLSGGQAAGCDFILSIAAGISIKHLRDAFTNPRVVRVMPNTPAMIGQGMAVWTATDEVDEVYREQAAAILKSLGQEVFVDDEGLLDAATAISGTGPAYVFFLMEVMIDVGVHLGFSRRVAEQLVLQTVKGTAEYAIASQQHVAMLRNQVTSPAGTTAEALYHMEKEGLRHALARGIWAAYQRSVTLGGGNSRNPDHS